MIYDFEKLEGFFCCSHTSKLCHEYTCNVRFLWEPQVPVYLSVQLCKGIFIIFTTECAGNMHSQFSFFLPWDPRYRYLLSTLTHKAFPHEFAKLSGTDSYVSTLSSNNPSYMLSVKCFKMFASCPILNCLLWYSYWSNCEWLLACQPPVGIQYAGTKHYALNKIKILKFNDMESRDTIWSNIRF